MGGGWICFSLIIYIYIYIYIKFFFLHVSQNLFLKFENVLLINFLIFDFFIFIIKQIEKKNPFI